MKTSPSAWFHTIGNGLQESVGVLVAARQGQRTHLKEAGDGLSGAEGRTSARKGTLPAGSKPAMPDCL